MTTTTADLAYQSATTRPSAQYSEAKAQCTLTPYLKYAEPYSNGWTYKQIIELAAGAGGVLCLILSAALIITHLTVWVRPNEQKQIVRIIFFAPVFVIFNFFALWFYDVSWILTPFAELYECFALVAMFYLLVLYVSPDEGFRENYFHHLMRMDKKNEQQLHGRGSLKWFQVTWVAVFQILPSKLAISILQWALNAGMCPIAYQDSKASTAVSVVQSIVTVICVMAIIRFEGRLKKEMVGHHPLAKLITFKGVVGIVLTQTPIFTALTEHQVFKPTKNVSIVDFAVGTPSFLVCIEMFLVSCLFLWSFSAKEYRTLARSQNLPRAGVGRALVDSLNISDILKGCGYMVHIILGGGLSRATQPSPAGPVKDIEDGYNPNGDVRPPPAMAAPYPPQYQQAGYAPEGAFAQQGGYEQQRPQFQQ